MFVARRTLLRYLLAAADATTLTIAFGATYLLVGRGFERQFASFKDYDWLLIVIIPLWLACLRAFGLYASVAYSTLRRVSAQLTEAHVLASLIFLSMMYLTKSAWVSRLLLQVFIVASMAALFLQKFLLRVLLGYFHDRDSVERRQVLLVATPDRVIGYLDFLGTHMSMNAKVLGFVDPRRSANRDAESQRS